MATVTHTIYSHYNPKQREILQRDTGQLEDNDDPWQTESSLAAKRRMSAAPRFVSAVASYDEWGSIHDDPRTTGNEEHAADTSLAGWYRSLTQHDSSEPGAKHDITRTSVPEPPRASSSSNAGSHRKAEARTKNNWFIMKAIQSEPPSASATPPPTLADILARDPPPLSAEKRFAPPVFLTIGPSNKGFAMLQQSGWSEGEPLGPHAVRRGVLDAGIMSDQVREQKWRDAGKHTVKRENLEVHIEEDVSEVRNVDVIDLTLSEPDSDAEIDSFEHPTKTSVSPHNNQPSDNSLYSGKALLTPIPTVLKSDRLGIGLKAKTIGPYKASQKRVTHNAAAMAAHIRTSEEMRRIKAKVGRGSRGLARVKKSEEATRQRLLAYMNE